MEIFGKSVRRQDRIVIIGGGPAGYEAALVAAQLDADVTVEFRNLSMSNLSPYSVGFAGREIDAGKLDLDLRYLVKQGIVEGQNKIVLRDLKLGDTVESPDAVSLPLDLAVALLKNAPNEKVGKIFLDWLFSMDGQKATLNGGYFAARKDIKFSEWEKEGVEMAVHAKKAVGVDSFWDLDVGFIEYDLDLATKESQENPVYYVQYGHARLCSILNQAAEIVGPGVITADSHQSRPGKDAEAVAGDRRSDLLADQVVAQQHVAALQTHRHGRGLHQPGADPFQIIAMEGGIERPAIHAATTECLKTVGQDLGQGHPPGGDPQQQQGGGVGLHLQHLGGQTVQGSGQFGAGEPFSGRFVHHLGAGRQGMAP